MEEQKKFSIDDVRKNLYVLAVHLEQHGNKKWADIIDQARDYLLELEKIKEKSK